MTRTFTGLVPLARPARQILWHGGGDDPPWLVVAIDHRTAELGGDELLYIDGFTEGFRPGGLAVAAKLGLFGFAVVEGEVMPPRAPRAPRKGRR